jgi:hypothetical protein
MKRLLRFLGCRCPVCNVAIPFTKATALLGNEDTCKETKVLRCVSCGSGIRAKGRRLEQAVILGSVLFPGQLLFYALLACTGAIVWSAGVVAFSSRIIPLEPTR